MDSRSTSRVVPAISVTIAEFCSAKALSKLDFPALGRPAMTRCIPSRSRLPCLAVLLNLFNCFLMVVSLSTTLLSAKKSISSSGKSSAASTYIRKWISCCNSSFTLVENSPCNERTADRAACSELLSIKSEIASACARSNLSFRKARSENSPGLAIVAPSSIQRRIIISKTTCPP